MHYSDINLVGEEEVPGGVGGRKGVKADEGKAWEESECGRGRGSGRGRRGRNEGR